MDEPTSGLDPLIRDKFLSLIREFMDKGGKGVLFSTHITSDLDKCADNIVFLHQGKILLEEDKDILLDKWRLVKGGLSSLTEGKKEFLNCLRTTDYGFTALIDDPEKAKQLFPDALLEHASIEDIMIALCEGAHTAPVNCRKQRRKEDAILMKQYTSLLKKDLFLMGELPFFHPRHYLRTSLLLLLASPAIRRTEGHGPVDSYHSLHIQ